MKKRFWLTCDDDNSNMPYYGVSKEPGVLDREGCLDRETIEGFMDEDAVRVMLGITLERGEQTQFEITARELGAEDEA